MVLFNLGSLRRQTPLNSLPKAKYEAKNPPTWVRYLGVGAVGGLGRSKRDCSLFVWVYKFEYMHVP